MDKVTAGYQPGKNMSPGRPANKASQLISRKAIEEAGKLTKMATALGGVLIFGGVSFANDAMVEAGENSGLKLVDRGQLMRDLQIADNDFGLPRGAFIIKYRYSEVRTYYQ